MTFKELVYANRSYRRFHQDIPIEMKTLEELVDMGRVSPTASNLQPLKYILSNTPEKNAVIFSNLMWARYLRPWMGPEEGERPVGYIIILGDKEIAQNFGCDHGIVAQTVKLGAWEMGWAGCIFMAIRKKELAEALKIPERYEILLTVALGKAKEKVVMDEIEPGGDIKYWRDKNDVHHVPKRKLKDVILRL